MFEANSVPFAIIAGKLNLNPEDKRRHQDATVLACKNKKYFLKTAAELMDNGCPLTFVACNQKFTLEFSPVTSSADIDKNWKSLSHFYHQAITADQYLSSYRSELESHEMLFTLEPVVKCLGTCVTPHSPELADMIQKAMRPNSIRSGSRLQSMLGIYAEEISENLSRLMRLSLDSANPYRW